ncbi:MAG: helix-turn-helix domain-containing protein [Phreatobacter oligotrophus]|nr:helix-turn-helix domain-containing protein [Phreatobacter oligotrophus]MBX9989353.1 helix-turn-helix domain-containing protein [Phreatobacter oligotrophus]
MAARFRRPPQPAALSASAPRERLAYSVDEAAACLGLSRAHVYRMIAQGRLQPRKAGKRTLILRSDLVAFLESLPH